MIKRQQGMTLIGLLITAVIAGAIVFAGLRLVPVYLEYTRIKSVLEAVKKDEGGQAPTAQQLRQSIERRLDVEYVTAVQVGDFKIQKTGEGHRISLNYAQETPYIGNVYFLVKFDTSIEIPR
jgi:Tfp pilus assembly major pilin PilA